MRVFREFLYGAGIYSTGYAAKSWKIRQSAGLSDPDETNARFCYLLDRGETVLLFAFDLFTPIKCRLGRAG